MNIQKHIKKLKNSKKYKDFVDEHKDAYFCSGFFSVDKEGTDNQVHLDFFSQKEKELYSFNFSEGVNLTKMDNFGVVPDKISLSLDLDLEKFEKLVEKEMNNRGIKTKVKKLLFSLQNSKKKDILFVTVFISNLGLVKVSFDIKSLKVISFEKKSFMDFFKIVKGSKKK